MNDRRQLTAADQVVEIVSPRTNTALLSAAEHIFSAMTMQQASDRKHVALEIAADAGSRRFLARCSTPEDALRIAGVIGSAYPQAELRNYDSATFPTAIPPRSDPMSSVPCAHSGFAPHRVFHCEFLRTAKSTDQLALHRPTRCWVSWRR